jgi:dTDP-glucose 4,6-dehydratase
MYTSDLAVWLWTILLKGENNVPYNVGSDEGMELRAVADLITEVQHGANVKILTAPDMSKPVERYVPDIDRAKQALGLGVKIRIKEAIEKTINFYSSLRP